MRILHWFRGDLRLRDNTALRAAAGRADELALLFIFDDALLSHPTMSAARVRFLVDAVGRLRNDLAKRGQTLLVRRGNPVDVLKDLATRLRPDELTINRETTRYAIGRDAAAESALEALGVRVMSFKDRVVFEADEVLTKSGGPYSVYGPYQKAWYRRMREQPAPPQPAPRLPRPAGRVAKGTLPTASDLGFVDDKQLPTAGEAAAQRRLARFVERRLSDYPTARDVPAVDGTSRISPHLRFGTLSPRDAFFAARAAGLARPEAAAGARKWMDELVWREFYAAVREHWPHTAKRSFRPVYDSMEWLDAPDEWEAFIAGQTGFPFVDAGIRQLLATGWMHNRVRMVVASFLTKDLLIDWRAGESFFMRHLVDGDPASNNGGWQWAASTGTDPQPYFRIFNPTTQGKTHDPGGTYVRRWIPELDQLPDRSIHEPWKEPLLAGNYPAPIVSHADRRDEALRRFRAAREHAGS